MKRSKVQTDSTATPSGRVGYSTADRTGHTAPPSGQRGELLQAARVTDAIFLVITFLFQFFLILNGIFVNVSGRLCSVISDGFIVGGW